MKIYFKLILQLNKIIKFALMQGMEASHIFPRNSSAPTPYRSRWVADTINKNPSVALFADQSCSPYQSAFNSTSDSLSVSDFPQNPGMHNVIHIYDCHVVPSPAPWNAPTPVVDPYDPVITFPTSITNSPFLQRNSSTGRGSINSAGMSGSALLRLSTSYARASPLSERDLVAGSPLSPVTNAADALRSSINQFAEGANAYDSNEENIFSQVKILQDCREDESVIDKEGVQSLLTEYLPENHPSTSIALSTFEAIAEEQLGVRSTSSRERTESKIKSETLRGDTYFHSADTAISMPFPQRLGENGDKVGRTRSRMASLGIPFGVQNYQSQSSSSRRLLSSAVKHQSRAVPKEVFASSVSDAFLPLKGITEQLSFTTVPVNTHRAEDEEQYRYSLKTKFSKHGLGGDPGLPPGDKDMSPISHKYTNQISRDTSGSIRLGETLLAEASPGQRISIIKRLLKAAMTHRDIDVVIYFTGKLVDMASVDSRVSREITDYIRFLEEHGYVAKAAALLIKCVENHLCSADSANFPEQLILKALKLYESIGEYDSCYHLIERTVQQYTQPPFYSSGNITRHAISLDKYWRVVFFGAYLEMLQGNHGKSREIISYLILHTKEAGPVIVDYLELELKYGSFKCAFTYIFQYFLREEILYSPLSLLSFELMTRGFPNNVKLVTGILKKMTSTCAINDIRWKLKCLCALYCVRNNDAEQALNLCFKALSCAKDGVQWRIFVLIAKIYFIRSCKSNVSDYWIREMKEKLFNNLTQAYQTAPLKSKLFVIIERAHYYEYYGDINTALSLLLEAIRANQKEWKYTLEYASILRRHNRLVEALESIAFSLTLGDNMSTGRLWALYASTAQSKGASSHYMVIKAAIYHCPKSADVWVELARLFLNPVYNCFNIATAEDALAKAVYYTPQYGDTYIEWLRLLVIKYLVYGTDISSVVRQCLGLCIDMKPTYGNLWSYCKAKTVYLGYCPVKDYNGPASISKSVIDCAFFHVIQDVYQNLDLYKVACRCQKEYSDQTTSGVVGALFLRPEDVQKKTPTQRWYNFNTAIGLFDKLYAEALNNPMSDNKERIDLIFGSDLVL